MGEGSRRVVGIWQGRVKKLCSDWEICRSQSDMLHIAKPSALNVRVVWSMLSATQNRGGGGGGLVGRNPPPVNFGRGVEYLSTPLILRRFVLIAHIYMSLCQVISIGGREVGRVGPLKLI